MKRVLLAIVSVLTTITPHFGQHVYYEVEPQAGLYIEPNTYKTNFHFAYIDADQYIDIIKITDSAVYWYKNNNGLTFAESEEMIQADITAFDILTKEDKTSEILIADTNGIYKLLHNGSNTFSKSLLVPEKNVLTFKYQKFDNDDLADVIAIKNDSSSFYSIVSYVADTETNFKTPETIQNGIKISKYYLPFFKYGLQVGDIFGDSQNEILFFDKGHSPNIIYLHGTENGYTRDTLREATSQRLLDYTIADIDGDDKKEVIYLSEYNGLQVTYFKTANDYTQETLDFVSRDYSGIIRANDINGDGKTDIIVNGMYYMSHTYISYGTGFKHTTPYDEWGTDAYPNNLDLADIDNDGDLDILTQRWEFYSSDKFEMQILRTYESDKVKINDTTSVTYRNYNTQRPLSPVTFSQGSTTYFATCEWGNRFLMELDNHQDYKVIAISKTTVETQITPDYSNTYFTIDFDTNDSYEVYSNEKKILTLKPSSSEIEVSLIDKFNTPTHELTFNDYATGQYKTGAAVLSYDTVAIECDFPFSDWETKGGSKLTEENVVLNEKVVFNVNSLGFACDIPCYSDWDEIYPVIKGEEQNHTLQKGWNLVTLLPDAYDMNPERLFPNAITIKDANEFFHKNQPVASNSLKELKSGNAYWVYNSISETLSIKGNTHFYPFTYDLQQGWNLVPYLGETNKPVADGFHQLYPQLEMVKDQNSSFAGAYPDHLQSLKKVSHQQPYMVKLNGSASLTWLDSTIQTRPTKPIAIYPEQNSWHNNTAITLKWEATDADLDLLTYKILLGESPNVETVLAENHREETYTISELHPEKTYYWQVIVFDEDINTDSSLVYSFTTAQDPSFETGEVIDIDGNIYSWKKYGEQRWMTVNLRTTSFADGTAIPFIGDLNGTDPIPEFGKAYGYVDSSYRSYPHFTKELFGATYTWGAATNWYSDYDGSEINQGACPYGWHLPSDEEWSEFELFMGVAEGEIESTSQYRGSNIGSKLSGQLELWDTLYTDLISDPEFGMSGFNIVPTGYIIDMNTGNTFFLSAAAKFWTNTIENPVTSYVRDIIYDKSGIQRNGYPRNYGASVRCVKDY